MRFLAAEKLSEHKYKTPEGYLVCVDAVLSRTGKQKYMRSELFGDECKNPTDEVEVDRLETDVFDEKAMASFENKPICIEHPDEDVNVANHNDLSVGFVRDIKRGTDNGQPVMLGTLVITDENAIDLVESGEYTELSCGYDCDIADDEHPTQRNIRGNHVALCKQGRAGNARIVDSVDEEQFEELETDLTDIELKSMSKAAQLLRKEDFGTPSGGGRSGNGKGEQRSLSEMQESINEAYEAFVNKEVADNKIFARLDRAIEQYEELAKTDNAAKRLLARGKNARAKLAARIPERKTLIERLEHQSSSGEQLSASQYYALHKRGYNNEEIAKMSKQQAHNIIHREDSKMKDANYEQWTKQGWRVVALYKDGGRIHAIVERKSGDFVVALGYNTSTGEWGQGRYVSTFGAAVDTLNEEKPGAVPIRDAKPAKKTFEVSFVKNGVTYIRNVKADSIQDAIRKAADERLSPMTYKKLKELGVSQRQWSGWSQEQANEYIRKHQANGANKAKEKTSTGLSKQSIAKADNILRGMTGMNDTDIQEALNALGLNDLEAWEEDRDVVSINGYDKNHVALAQKYFASRGYDAEIETFEDENHKTGYSFTLGSAEDDDDYDEDRDREEEEEGYYPW